MNCNIEIILITRSKYRDVWFNLALFYNISLLYDNVVKFCTYDVLDMSRVTVWLFGSNNNNNNNNNNNKQTTVIIITLP